jgi:hypothetical protein
MAKKGAGTIGGFLLFLGSLVYLYVGFTWYSSGTSGPWLTAAQFFSPFIAALALISAIVLFFMSLAGLMGKVQNDKMMDDVLWKFIIWGGATFFIITAGGSWFYWAVLAFVLTYLGVASKKM